MKSSEELRNMIRSIDHRGYPAYKELRGQYDFGTFVLSIDHVQGDPFASPSRLSVRVSKGKAGFPAEFYDTVPKRITLQDHLTRLFGIQLQRGSSRKGSGKSGLLAVSHCGQQVLERTACRVQNGDVTLRFEAGFPAHGRTIDARGLLDMLFDILPDCVIGSLYYRKINQRKLKEAIELCEDQQYIREKLNEMGLCAFIANGSVLPRETGVSERPMPGAVAFQSPESLKVSIDLPNRGTVQGMGIPKGVTLFVGGGYHGKSTVLQALQNGVYNHIAGDGRELVITDASAWKLRAEDGRCITGVDISPFIRQLPGKRDTVCFSSQDASGSTSQAANLMESIESGSKLLLIDEDTSATNFMIRDRLMQQVVSADEEPIVPFIERVRSLYEDHRISSIIVAGSSGAYFEASDTVVQMKEYVPVDITKAAKDAAAKYPVFSARQEPFPEQAFRRQPKPNMAVRKSERLKLKSAGTAELLFGDETVEVRYMEQLKDREQTMALAYLLKYLELNLIDGRRTVRQLADLIEQLLDVKGLEGLFERGDISSSLARPRRQEILACLNRYRGLRM